MDSQSLTPKVIKEELDRYVIGQDDAKKAVAIALRNRWRRLNVKDETCLLYTSPSPRDQRGSSKPSSS